MHCARETVIGYLNVKCPLLPVSDQLRGRQRRTGIRTEKPMWPVYQIKMQLLDEFTPLIVDAVIATIPTLRLARSVKMLKNPKNVINETRFLRRFQNRGCLSLKKKKKNTHYNIF